MSAIGLGSLVFCGLGGSLSLFGAEPIRAQTVATACSPIRLQLSNPAPGDLLFPGSLAIQGQATDVTTGSGSGIDRVQIFFDHSRDSGGRLVGEVLAGNSRPDQRLDSDGFTVVATIPDTRDDNNTHQLYAYARSAQTGQEQSVAITVQLNKPLSVGQFTPTPTPPPAVLAQPPCGSPTPTPTFPPFPLAAADATPGATATVTLSVANPSPGAAVAAGMYVITGLAFDTAATGSAGVDRVQVFLDPREQGGALLGDARLGLEAPGGPFGFQLVAPLPHRKGSHLLSVYAHSAVADREATVQIPITID